jgi:tight adherence protein B
MTSWIAALALAVAIAISGRPRPATRLLASRGGVGVHVAPDASPATRDARQWGLALAGAGILVVARVPPTVVLGAVALAILGSRLQRRRLAARARDQCSAATVEVTFALAGELRAGRTPAQALAAVAGVAGPLRPAFEAAYAAAIVGGGGAEQIAQAAAIPGAERLRYVAAAWAVAESTGGRVAVVLEGLSEAMDDDDELHRELDAAMAGPRATMVMLGGLPLLGLLLGQSVGARPFQLLLHRPLGWALFTGAVGLDGIGVLVTRTIARAALRA